jgi:hypothetical protein
MMSIDITIRREQNGRKIITQASLTENGWEQWGGTASELAETCDLLDRLQAAAHEAGAFEEEENEEEEI